MAELATKSFNQAKRENQTILIDGSGTFHVEDIPQRVCLTAASLTLSPLVNDSGTQEIVIDVDDIIGCNIRNKDAPNDSMALIEIYHYPVFSHNECKACMDGRRHASHIILSSNSTNHESDGTKKSAAVILMKSIKLVSRRILPNLDDLDAPAPEVTTLVVYSPASGRGRSPLIYLSTVQPMLQQAGINHEILETTHRGHAHDHMKNMQTDSKAKETGCVYDYVIVIGGDGLISEVVCGLHDRSDNLLSNLPIACIPGGSGNGLAMSILSDENPDLIHDLSPLDAMFVAVKGWNTPLGLASVDCIGQSIMSFLCTAWGVVANIDIRSEFMRFLGENRFFLYAVYEIMRNQSFPARLFYYPFSGEISNHTIALPPLDQDIPDNAGWIEVSGQFKTIWISQVSYVGESVHLCPKKSLDDGFFDIMYAYDDMTRGELLDLIDAVEKGMFAMHPKVHSARAVAWRLVPQDNHETEISIDGELPNQYGPVQGKIHKSALLVKSRNMRYYRGE